MVDVPVSPVRQLPHRRLPRSTGNAARLVATAPKLVLPHFSKNTRQKTVSSTPSTIAGLGKHRPSFLGTAIAFSLRKSGIPRCIVVGEAINDRWTPSTGGEVPRGRDIHERDSQDPCSNR